MNMRFQHPQGIELKLLRQGADAPSGPLPEVYKPARPNALKFFLLPLAALAVAYGLTTLSATALWIIAAACVGLVGLATAVCLYALNNTL